MYPSQLIQEHLPKASKFFVAVKSTPSGKKIIGCCALEIYSKRLAEIRSLAVEKSFQGNGIATELVKSCLKLAQKNKIYEVLSITGEPRLFERAGFKTFNKERFALLKILRSN